jgi:hypothetical protein
LIDNYTFVPAMFVTLVPIYVAEVARFIDWPTWQVPKLTNFDQVASSSLDICSLVQHDWAGFQQTALRIIY